MKIGRLANATSACSKAIGLSKGFSQNHCCRQRDVNRAQTGLHGDDEVGIRCRMHRFGDASAFTANQQDIRWLEGKARIRLGRLGGEENQAMCGAGGAEGAPARVPDDFGLVQVIHAGAPEFGFAPQKTAGLDNIHRHAQAGAKADEGAGVLGYVRLKKGEVHGIS